MILSSKNIRLVPFESCDSAGVCKLVKWYYDEKYGYFFRHQPRVWLYEELAQYPKTVGAMCFFIQSVITGETVGFIQICPESKTNKAFHIGIIIDEAFQKQHLPEEAFILAFDYCFNRLGFRKAIIEIMESHASLKRTIESTGFLFEGKLIGDCFYNGQFVNELRYCMFDKYFNQKYSTLTRK
jgi:RimJ/RimL family protein N-acetyltransferase